MTAYFIPALNDSAHLSPIFRAAMTGPTAAPRRRKGRWTATLKIQALVLGSCLLLQWIIELVDRALLGGELDSLGIQPRTLIGLRGIPLAPLVHANLDQVIANTMPFLVLGWLVMLRGPWTF